MDLDIRAAVERLRLAGRGPWYVARCARLRDERDDLAAVVAATDLAVRVHDVRSPVLTIDAGPLLRRVGNLELEYWLSLKLSALCNVVFARSTVQTRNLVAGRRGAPFLVSSQLAPALAPFAAAATALEPLGWRVVSAEAAYEHCPGLAFDPQTTFRGSLDTYLALTVD